MTPLQTAAQQLIDTWNDPKGRDLGAKIAMLGSALRNELAKAK